MTSIDRTERIDLRQARESNATVDPPDLGMKSLSLLFAILWAAGPAAAGVRFETAIRDAKGGSTPLHTTWIQDGMARIENTERPGATLFRDDSLILLDPKTQTYRVIDSATLERLAQSWRHAISEARAMLDVMTPAQRSATEKSLRERGIDLNALGRPAPLLETRSEGEGRFDGRPCRIWKVLRGGVPTKEFCTVPLETYPGAAEAREVTQKISALLGKIVEGMPLGSSVQGSTIQAPDDAADVQGQIVVTRHFNDGVPADEAIVLVEWTQENFPADRFEIPITFRRQEILPREP